jgi:hypothetical protein
MNCRDLTDVTLCARATKDTYPNLVIDSTSYSSSSKICVWDGDTEMCVEKDSFKNDFKCDEFSVDMCGRLSGCAVIGGMFFFYYLLFDYNFFCTKF